MSGQTLPGGEQALPLEEPDPLELAVALLLPELLAEPELLAPEASVDELPVDELAVEVAPPLLAAVPLLTMV